MNEQMLILLVGLPYSGKSTWAKQQNKPIVNPDSIRLALHGQRFFSFAEPFVWAITYLMIKALFLAGHDEVIVDATHITEKRRQQYRDIFKDGVVIAYKHIDTSKNICIERARSLKDSVIIPVIERMANEFEEIKKPVEEINK